MAGRLRETIHNYLLASAISIPMLFPLKASAEILEKKVINFGKEYNITIDTEKKEYMVHPDAEEAVAGEMLASYMLDEIGSSIKEKITGLNEKTEQFVLENPSEMHLSFSEFNSASLIKNTLEFQPYNIPKMNFNAWKRGNKVSLKFNLESQDYAFDWYKNCGITALYSKDSKIIGRGPDKVYVLGKEKDNLGMCNIEEDNFSGEREAYGMLADAILKKGLQKARGNPLGMILSSAMKIEDMLTEDEKTKREKVMGDLKSRYNCLSYSPAYFYATPEQGRSMPVKFDKNPEELYFFINSNIVLTKEGQGSQSKKGGVLVNLVKIDTKKVTDETSVGKIIKHSGLLSKRINDLLYGYENKKQRIDLKEKASLYESLSVWSAQIGPFIDMLSKLQNKEIQGSIENLPEFQEFKKDAQKKTEQIVPLKHLVDEYKFISRYSKNDRDKILELIKREERARKENNLEMYLSCLSKHAIEKNRNIIEAGFGRRDINLKEDYKIGNIFVKGDFALVSIENTLVMNGKYEKNLRYDATLIRERGEWKYKDITTAY